MHKTSSSQLWMNLQVRRESGQPLQAQLCEEIRRLVRGGRLNSGDRLPSSRQLAADLAVSRITVVGAYDQLVSEGYLVGRRGAGMFVAPDLDALPQPPAPLRPVDLPKVPGPARPFDTAVPEIDTFPHRVWARLFDQVWRAPEPGLMGRGDPFGWGPLRLAIARHLQDWRGIACAPEQVVVTSGLTEAVGLLAVAAFDPGTRVAVEEPGHGVLRTALRDGGARLCTMAVDEEGFDPGLLAGDPEIRVAAVTPSRQFPLGMTLPLARRLRLLAWAAEVGGWVIEDDYDGEYRYRGQPLPAMMGLDEDGRVIYAGSFSKVMFPGLRLAYLVLPERLVDPVGEVLERRGAQAAIVAQPVLARFLSEGHFDTHLRRMRRLYAQRQRALVEALAGECGDLLEAEDVPSGMHLVARLSPALEARMTDREAATLCAQAGLKVRALSDFYDGVSMRQGLVLGFAGFDAAALRMAAKDLSACLRR